MTNTDTNPTDTPTAITPGWKTTEFRLKVAAFILTALYASGVIPTSGIAATLMAIGATMLGALGYTVSRTFVKTAGALFLVFLFASAPMLASCATVKAGASAVGAGAKAAEAKVVKCAKADAGPIALAFGQLALQATMSYAATGSVNFDSIEHSAEESAKAQGVAIAGCAFKPVLELIAKLFPSTVARGAQGLLAPPDIGEQANAALARFKAAHGIAVIETENGSN